MRCTPIRCTPIRCTPMKMHARKRGSRERHVYKNHQCGGVRNYSEPNMLRAEYAFRICFPATSRFIDISPFDAKRNVPRGYPYQGRESSALPRNARFSRNRFQRQIFDHSQVAPCAQPESTSGLPDIRSHAAQRVELCQSLRGLSLSVSPSKAAEGVNICPVIENRSTLLLSDLVYPSFFTPRSASPKKKKHKGQKDR
jgi:hypothetical protein